MPVVTPTPPSKSLNVGHDCAGCRTSSWYVNRAELWNVLEPQGAEEQRRSLEDRDPSQGLG